MSDLYKIAPPVPDGSQYWIVTDVTADLTIATISDRVPGAKCLAEDIARRMENPDEPFGKE
jgi:hypothetical protein